MSSPKSEGTKSIPRPEDPGGLAQELPQAVLPRHPSAPPALALGFYSLPSLPHSQSILTSLILQDFVEPLQRCLLLRVQVL